ncbi:MAG: OmpA family protein [Bacteroidales bacterium]|nr:OmpA family protein [Bacteroides sp.]MCM1199069.1 OmpA family protein [Clostridium sp.]MCM1502339.1 OmpA family protein [Bacteroidales bacterium]
MRKILLAGFAALAISSLSFNVLAQENGNRDSLNRIVRGPYETNRFGDNWFIGVGGGINLFMDGGGHKTRVAPAIDVTVGKWFTPSVGARIGYNGLRANGWMPEATVVAPDFVDSKNMYKEKVNYAFAHADLLWNISNAFSGYKETRFWNVIPYATFGFMHSYGVKGVDHKDNEFAAGAGILNNLRLSNRVNLTLDGRAVVVKGTFNGMKGGVTALPSLTVGVSVNLGKTNWKRATQVPAGYAPYCVAEVNDMKSASDDLRKENAALAKKNNALSDELAALKKENEELRNKAAEKIMLDVTPGAVFFNIGETKLDARELFHLDFYLQNVIAQDKEKVFVLTGYADKQTGTKKRNQQLSEQRVQYVYDLLRNKYNVPAERLVIKAVGSENNRFSDPVLNRSVVIE